MYLGVLSVILSSVRSKSRLWNLGYENVLSAKMAIAIAALSYAWWDEKTLRASLCGFRGKNYGDRAEKNDNAVPEKAISENSLSRFPSRLVDLRLLT